MFSYPLKMVFLVVGLFVFLAGLFYPGLEVDASRALIFLGIASMLGSLVLALINQEGNSNG